ncbi:MAG: sulfite exporter TauE/SafE family protein [Candidatus Undinarchaeales archaeon]|jgi:cytochrome c biogenesis protein CcdA|nr:sulfite exporter TauE/SafE family protein [Candidatus Undinarchaeales archaeon]MDP7494288.1 sulfite exporter TauE/SafE family protein [Candidatus Undinarchaeales archaeon]
MVDPSGVLPPIEVGLGYAFMYGLSNALGACLYSCLPVYMPIIVSYGDSPEKGFKLSLGFAAGRFTGYFLLGIAAAMLGAAFIDILSTTFPRISNVVLAILGFVTFLYGAIVVSRTGLPAISGHYCAAFRDRTRGIDNPYLAAYLLGLTSTVTPCVPIFTFLLLPFALGRVWETVPVTLAFGLGANIPFIVIGVGLALGVQNVKQRFDTWRPRLELFSGLMLLLFGAIYVLWALGPILFGWQVTSFALPDVRDIIALVTYIPPAVAQGQQLSPCLLVHSVRTPGAEPYVGRPFNVDVVVSNICEKPIEAKLIPSLPPGLHTGASSPIVAIVGPLQYAMLRLPLWSDVGWGDIVDVSLLLAASDDPGRFLHLVLPVELRNPFLEMSFLAITIILILGTLVRRSRKEGENTMLSHALRTMGVIIVAVALLSLVRNPVLGNGGFYDLELLMVGAVMAFWSADIADLFQDHPDMFLLATLFFVRFYLFEPAYGLGTGMGQLAATARTYVMDLSVALVAFFLPPVFHFNAHMLPSKIAPVIGGTAYLCWWLILLKAIRRTARARAPAAEDAIAPPGLTGDAGAA